jgi:cytoskeletal protein CcmA (bactofilin family)
MGIFSSKTDAAGEKPAATGKGAPAATNLSIVGAGMRVRGDLETDGVVKVEGTVEGNVRAGSQILVAQGGAVHGDIVTTDVIVGGAVHGAIRASGRVEVQTSASIDGDITTRRIAVAEGATLNGQIKMSDGGWGRDEATSGPTGGVRTPPAPGTPGGVPPRGGASGQRP